MPKTEMMIIQIETDPELTLEEVCQACQISPDFVAELVAYGAIDPKGHTVDVWRFDAQHLRRIRRVLHLQQDLEVNLPGAVLAIDLMEQIEELQAQVELLEKYLRTAR